MIHPEIKKELDSLSIQFPGQAQINLDQYAELYKIGRRDASRHLRRRNIPANKEGKSIYISILDLAEYKAKNRLGNTPLIKGYDNLSDEMKSRRGFCQMHEKRFYE